MGHHDFAVPIRFLALVGHFFAALLTVYAIRDNVIVALPYHYQQSELEDGLRSARAAIVVCVCVLFINSIGFLGGFSTFDLPASIFHIVAHTAGGLLLCVTVINKGHYYYIWYIVAFFSGAQLLVECLGFLSVCLLRKRRF